VVFIQLYKSCRSVRILTCACSICNCLIVAGVDQLKCMGRLIKPSFDYCSALLLNLPAARTNHLQLILNCTARSVNKTTTFHHITPILKSLHWLKINERIKYKVLSFTYKSLKTGQPSYLRFLLSYLHIVLLDLLLSPLVALLSPLAFKLQIDLIIILLLFCGIVYHLIYVTLFITSLLHLYLS